MAPDKTKERMLEMLKANHSCVLATASLSGLPHASLMGYVADETALSVFMITPRGTRKYSNLKENPRASLLVRQGDSALTVACTAEEENAPEPRRQMIEIIVGARPGLAELAGMDDIAVFRFNVETVQLLDGPVKSEFRNMDRENGQ